MELLWAISNLRTPFGDQFFQAVTYLGQELLPVAVICAFYWCINKNLATQIGLTFLSSGVLVQGFKITFRVPRPWVLDPNFKPIESAVSAATGYSFPSGHTQSGTSLFAPLACNTKKMLYRVLFVMAFLLVGFSRMYLGCHTLKDVATSWVLASVIAFIVYRIRHIIEKPAFVKMGSAIIFAVAVLLCIYAYALYANGIIEIHYVEDCFKMAGASIGFSIGWYLEKKTLNFSPTNGNPDTKKLVIRFLIGIVITVALYAGSKVLLAKFFIGKFIRYTLVILWIIWIYPALFIKYNL